MILDLQRRIAEIGRIRIGQQVPAEKGTRPTKLETFRLTSADKTRIEEAAHLYGGQVTAWKAPAGNQWEVITDATALPVIVPPGDLAFSQHYELWTGGGCQRRCDGANEQISGSPCLCDPDPAARECSIHSRLSLMLRDMHGLGLWRLDTQGYYAATELRGTVDILQTAAGRGVMLPATLHLEQRMVKRLEQKIRRFAVPVLTIDASPAQLLSGRAGVVEMAEIEAPPPSNNGAPLTPVPVSVPERPAASIAEQAAAVKPRRKGSQVPIPRTGIQPRTAALAAAPYIPPDERVALYEPEPEQAAVNRQMAAAFGVDIPAGVPGGPVEDTPEPMSQRQLNLIQKLFRERGFGDQQRPDRLDYCVSVIGRQITSSKELTSFEASEIIDSLKN